MFSYPFKIYLATSDKFICVKLREIKYSKRLPLCLIDLFFLILTFLVFQTTKRRALLAMKIVKIKL